MRPGVLVRTEHFNGDFTVRTNIAVYMSHEAANAAIEDMKIMASTPFIKFFTEEIAVWESYV